MQTDDVLKLLQEVAEEVINPRFRSLDDEQVTHKKPGDLVTVADHEAEERITTVLAAAYPDAVILGEEATHTDPALLDRFRSAEHAFTVDPVDGTRNFVKGSPDHAVMVAEVRGGDVTRSWVWQPQHQKAYVAELGAGAWRNGERLHRPAPQEDLHGVTSRKSWLGRALGTMRRLELTWVCCGVDYPRLIEGAADYALYRKGHPWDHAPGSVLLSEAGGYLGTFDGTPYRPQDGAPAGLIAAADRATYDLVHGLLPDFLASAG